jgi:hypothetical protein
MRLRFLALCLLTAMLWPSSLAGYGVLSHEELIDISWDSDIRPALLRRFPQATEQELQRAHAFAYGGSVIQDLGYYPFGDHEFTNMLHYVRTGAFVTNMLRDARGLNEYAFALGALSHYAADVWGHPAVNAGVPIEYPKLRAKFGNVVTYEENPEAHLKTEFMFDVVQVAKRRYISKQYHDFIGFEVASDLLKRAFQDTYAVSLDDILRTLDLSVESYRFGVSRVIPEMTQVALASRKHNLPREKQDVARKEFLYHLSRADYERDFGSKYRKPGIFARILAFLLKLIPKFGSFKALTYKDPTPQTEDLYFSSMDNVVAQYHRLLHEAETGELHLPNRNLDTGDLTRPGAYYLADRTYGSLVRRLGRKHFAGGSQDLKKDLLQFFASEDGYRGMPKKERRGTERLLAPIRNAAPEE